MNNKIMYVILVSVFILVSCSSNTNSDKIVFIGEGQKWKAEFKIIDLSDGKNREQEKIFLLQYKGNETELSKINSLSYKYQSSYGTAGNSIKSPIKNSELTMRSYSIGSLEDKNSNIEVEVEWDGNKEIFSLKLKE